MIVESTKSVRDVKPVMSRVKRAYAEDHILAQADSGRCPRPGWPVRLMREIGE
jgi:hypothetical protein